MTNPEPTPRKRVVLAHRRGARMVRTRVELQEQTEVGDALVRGLVRAQLGLALRLATVVLCIIGAIPLLGNAFPALEALTLFGVKVNWLILSVLLYALLFGVGRLFVRLAEQGERDFIGIVNDGLADNADEP
ncbi:hypothetical protein [Mycolicibacterium komossense]|jgi:hypothetical protein|uniref:Integral membrane protein n=1 Tax=Mycolicibacterium komossense TaxID=1779 RepID=A0ABT3C4R2_9MYCO|nr:hypothetical protein [Mycolicibacterium komossense]MCV7224462.1 hypothetical protein [Mycolicibacterium komossense]